MRVTPGHWIMPFVAAAAGLGLVLAGSQLGWGPAWVWGGWFFVVTGAGAFILTLAWVLPGPAGSVLRHPLISLLILLTMGVMLFGAVAAGLSGR